MQLSLGTGLFPTELTDNQASVVLAGGQSFQLSSRLLQACFTPHSNTEWLLFLSRGFDYPSTEGS